MTGGRSTSGAWRAAVYTFAAVFLSILAVAAITVPTILDFAERVYLELLDDINERQARAMNGFLLNRLATGADPSVVAAEFQAAIEGSEMDRGYVCLIEQEGARYIGHPDANLLGMDVKPGAIFTPAPDPSDTAPWRSFLSQGLTANGHLSFGPDMAQEMIYFTTVPGTAWTISTHGNLARIDAELRTLRVWLLTGALILSLVLALPTSLAARAVSLRRESQLQRQAELERRLLEQEDARKSQELDQARTLQLSLLPKEMPSLPGLAMAAHMQTATEVGGDYYDVIEHVDGAVTFAIGDATGHGLQAGMMAAAVKGLFAVAASRSDLVEALREMDRALKQMKLGRLNMAFALGRVRGPSLELVGAGMPPALIHRGATGEVEQVDLGGVPLGSPLDFPYRRNTLELAAGDTVLLTSDGLTELSGRGGEQLGYDSAERAFEQAAARVDTPDRVVEELMKTVASWSTGPLEDDVTLVVLRAT